MVQRELDLVLVQSTITQSSSAVGMLASEELARIDLDAETLLDDVATGRTALPLSPAKSAAAARLATQLRLHLIEGVPRRRVDPETWQAIRVVGPHIDSVRSGQLHVDIECSIDNPADA